MMTKMEWKEGDSIGKSQQGMNTKLQVYHHSDSLDMGNTTDLHGDLGWEKTNNNFGGVLEALRRYHQGGKMGIDRMDGPPTATTSAVTAYSYNSGLDPDSGGREDSIRTKNERKMREER